MSLRSPPGSTLDAYFEVELHSPSRFEYRDGAILPMSGGSWRHDEVSVAAITALRARFRSPCRVFGPNLRIVTGDDLYTYADAGVVCGPQDVSKHRGTDTLRNPSAVVEVLSPSTRAYDLGEKLDAYRSTPSIRDVLLVEAEAPDVLHAFRTESGWALARHEGLDAVVHLRTGDVTLPLRELYEGVVG
jgi:Uma2 family endonuclease